MINVHLLYLDDRQQLQTFVIEGATFVPAVGGHIHVTLNDTSGECKVLGLTLHLTIQAIETHYTVDKTQYGKQTQTDVICNCSVDPA